MVVDPGFSPEARARDAGERGQAARRGARDARARRPRRGSRHVRRRRSRSTCTRPTPSRSPTSPRGAQGSRTRSHPRRSCAPLADGDVLQLAGLAIEVLHTPGHTPGHCVFRIDADVALMLGRPGVRRIDRAVGLPELRPGGDAGEPGTVPDAARRGAGAAGPRAARRPWGANGRRTRSCGSSSDGARAASRAPRTCCPIAPTRCWASTRIAHRIARTYGFRYVETPTFEQTELFARTSGDDLRRRDEGDVHVRGQGRAFGDAASGEHGRRRAGLPHPRAVAAESVQGVLRRLGVPPRPAAAGPSARVPAVRRRGDRHGGPGRRRRGDRARRPVPAGARAHRASRCTSTRSATRSAVPPTASGCSSYLEPYRDELDEDCRTRLEKNPLRVFDCKVDGGKDFVLAAPDDRRASL